MALSLQATRRIQIWRLEILAQRLEDEEAEEVARTRPISSRTPSAAYETSSAASSSAASSSASSAKQPRLLARVKAKLAKLGKKEPEPGCKTEMYKPNLKLSEWRLAQEYDIWRGRVWGDECEVDFSEVSSCDGGADQKREERLERARRLLEASTAKP